MLDTYNTSTIFQATYTRDGNAQVTSDSSATSNQNSYGYTPLNQLCYAGSSSSSACSSPPSGAQAFTYNTADDLITFGGATQSFNTADQLTAGGTNTYAVRFPGQPHQPHREQLGHRLRIRPGQPTLLCGPHRLGGEL